MVLRLMSFHLTWNWHGDFHRTIHCMLSEELCALSEELYPISADRLAFMDQVIVSDDELKKYGHYSEVTLNERFR